VLDALAEDTVACLRDRVILPVGLRRAEIAALSVGDLYQNRGYDSLRVMRKGGRRDALAINPQTAARIRVYLELAGHGADIDGPLVRPLRHNGERQEERRRMDPDAIDRVVRKYATEVGLDRGYSAHSMRATFITTALENGAQLEDVQEAAGHRDSGTTKLYDRRGYNPEKAASFLLKQCFLAPRKENEQFAVRRLQIAAFCPDSGPTHTYFHLQLSSLRLVSRRRSSPSPAARRTRAPTAPLGDHQSRHPAHALPGERTSPGDASVAAVRVGAREVAESPGASGHFYRISRRG
jgi:hypothetical protein